MKKKKVGRKVLAWPILTSEQIEQFIEREKVADRYYEKRSFEVGEEAYIDAELAARWIAEGVCVPVEEAVAAGKK